MQLQIVSSPSDDVVLSRYTERDFPVFRPIFEAVADDSPLRHFARDPEEASAAVILENQSKKEITALRYRWVTVNAGGKTQTSTVSSDSYMVDVYRPVAAVGARQILTPSAGILDETLIHHALAGGGLVGGGSRRRLLPETVEVWFQIDLIVFADGEIAGSDPDHFAAELQSRKLAAGYVAQQVRSAKEENRDVMPVLRALRNIPHLRTDYLAHLVSRYARTYLDRSTMTMGSADMSEATLKHLETRPTLPKFYRRSDAGE